MGVSVTEEVDLDTQRVLITRLASAPPEHLSVEAVTRVKKWVTPSPRDVQDVLSISGASVHARRLLREILTISEQNENRKH